MGPGAMSAMNMASDTADPIPPTVTFPYGFPTSGRYRIFLQMKHGATVETGVFDAEVHPFKNHSRPLGRWNKTPLRPDLRLRTDILSSKESGRLA